MVVTDLLAKIKSVLSNLKEVSTSLIQSGSVLSKTYNLGKPGLTGKLKRKSSGARLDPPIPNKRSCSTPSFLTSSVKLSSSSKFSKTLSATKSQPKEFG